MPTSPTPPSPRSLGLVLGLALIVRLVALGVWQSDLLLDRDAYLGIAANITRGVGFCQPETMTPTAFRPPLYPLLIGCLQFVIPKGLAVAAINLVAGLGTVWGTAILAQRWWPADSRAAVIAAGLVALDPLLVRYVAQPMTESLFAALVSWTLLGIDRFFDPEEKPRVWAAGLLAGLTLLCRPTLLPFLGLVSTGMLIAVVRHQQTWQRLIVWSMSAGLPLCLWGLRNWLVLGVFLLTTTHGGYTLHLANNPVFYREVVRQPWGTVWGRKSLLQWQAGNTRRMTAEFGPHAGEFREDGWHNAEAKQTIGADRTGFWLAVLYRQRSFWSLAPRGEAAVPSGLSVLIAGWYALLFVGTVYGLLSVHRQCRWLSLALILSIAAVHLFYWTDTRMRSPLHPVFAVLAVGALQSVGSVLRARSSSAGQTSLSLQPEARERQGSPS